MHRLYHGAAHQGTPAQAEFAGGNRWVAPARVPEFFGLTG